MTEQNPHIYIDIFGPHDLWNMLLSYTLERELGARCSIADRIPPAAWESRGDPPATLLLLDCGQRKPAASLRELEKARPQLPLSLILALYNLSPRAALEREALGLGVTGIFYASGDLGQFLKGVRALLANQVWIPRSILAEYALNGGPRRSAASNEENGLTRREIEILSFVSQGANNSEIAERLFISPFTVKTHLYHIFKKIGVPNRFQAALWTVKNLSESSLRKE